MENVSRYVIPSTLICGLVLSILGFLFMTGVTVPAHASDTNLFIPTLHVAQTSISEFPSATQEDKSQPIECKVSSKFPENIRQWCHWITQYAEINGLPPDLIAALIWQESGGNPMAYSHSGAVGLMQVMPRDGIAASFMCPNGPCFANRPTISELQEPRFNIEYGTSMLAGLLMKYGDLREALRSYGPKDVGYRYADKVLDIYYTYKE